MMEPGVILAVLTAAFLHALWNFLLRRSTDKFLAMSAVTLGHVPPGIIGLVYAGPAAAESLGFVIMGAVLHTGYQLFLLNAYRYGSLTQVYPVARGVAPLLITIFSLFAFDIKLSPLALGGIGLISFGLIFHGLQSRGKDEDSLLGFGLALVTGCFIASYSIVDGLGARIAGSALGFYSTMTLLNAGMFALVMMFYKPGMPRLVITKGKAILVFGGGVSFLAYALVVWACMHAPIAMVSALRETSVLFALVMAIFWLREPVTWQRGGLILMLVSGVVILRLA